MRVAHLIHRRIKALAGEFRATYAQERPPVGHTLSVRAAIIEPTCDLWGQFSVLLQHDGGRLVYKPDHWRYRVWRALP